jgi:hypothetical protein
MTRRLTPVLVLPLALVLTGCAGASADRLASSGTTESQESVAVAAEPVALAQDLRPLAAQSIELAGLVQAAATDPAVVALVERIAGEQQALLDDVDALLAGTTSLPGEAASLSAAELDAIRSAAGDEAVRLGLDGLLRTHLDEMARAKAEVAEGRTGAQGELSRRVLDEQGATLQELSALG